VSGVDVTWDVKGQENTIDHYTVFASLDGENLMPLADVPAGVHQLSLPNFQLSQGNYSLYVKAVGKPSLTNKMSSAIPYSVLNIPPVAAVNVSAASGTAPVTVTVSTAASVDPDGKIASSKIDFGDGTIVTGSTGSHTYTAAGTYTITATVSDNSNAAASATTSVFVKENMPPAAAISVTPANGITPSTVTACTAASKDSDGTIASSAIDFGDGTVLPGPTASHIYSTAGVFVVKALVTDNGGLSSITSTTINIAAPIPFAVKVSSPVDGSSVNGRVHFIATTTSPSPVTAMRIYVDGVSAYSSNMGTVDTILTLAPGIRNVVLQAWNKNGQITKTPLRLTVINAAPTVSLSVTPSSGVAPLSIAVAVVASDPDGFVKSTIVDFGDGVIGYSASATHIYAVPGVYTATAKVMDNNGATVSTSTTITVKPAGGVVILTPRAGTTTGTAVEVSALANSPTSIKAMRLYVDGRAVFSTADSSMDTFLALNIGNHEIVVQAWDVLGKVYKASVVVTVK
jgi:PKD repeat protein